VLDEPVELPEGTRVEVAIQEKLADRGPTAAKGTSIEDQLAAIWQDVPLEEWKHVPADLSDHLDHYIYGAPKR
jgi:hypothetical protein